MRNIFILFIFIGINISSGYGQITVSNSLMPGIGDTLRYTSATITSGLSFTDTGASQNWDYSQLTPQMQVFEEYKRASSVNIAYALFGLSAIGLKVQDSLGMGTFKMKNIYDFFKNSSSAFTAEGRGLEYNGMPVPSWYSDKDEIYQFPLQFGDRDSSTFHVKFDLAGTITFIQKGYRINKAEGWGTLTTPYVTYSNCLKIKTNIFRRDSLKVDALPFPIAFNSNLIEYKWFAQGIKGPVMIVNATVGLGGAVTVTSIRYRDERRELLGFSVNPQNGDTNQPFVFNDTSQVTALLRQWTFTPSTIEFLNGTNSMGASPEVRFKKPGWYDVELSVTTAAGTDKVLRTRYIEVTAPDPVPNNVHTYHGQNALRALPNPFTDRIQVYGYADQIVFLTLFDMTGAVLATAPDKVLCLDTPPNAGFYLLRAVSSDGQPHYFKVRCNP